MDRLTVFISSTVKDFGPVRSDIAEWLRGRGCDVRVSEGDDFPVAPHHHSHLACLEAIAGSHLYVLLIGHRYGGKYLDTQQSITWREYDEARALGLPVVALVLGSVTAGSIAKTLDRDVERFLTAVRKAPVDNWVHTDWDGSFTHARALLDARMNALWVAYQRPSQRLLERVAAENAHASARVLLDEWLAASLRDATTTRGQRLDRLLQLVAIERAALFGFRPADRYNLAVYGLTGGRYVLAARSAHEDIPRTDRTWDVGSGHVGGVGAQRALLVTPDLSHTSSWVNARPTDAENYVSAIGVPLGAETPAPAVLIVTSSRKDHFVSREDTYALTARSLGAMAHLIGVEVP